MSIEPTIKMESHPVRQPSQKKKFPTPVGTWLKPLPNDRGWEMQVQLKSGGRRARNIPPMPLDAALQRINEFKQQVEAGLVPARSNAATASQVPATKPTPSRPSPAKKKTRPARKAPRSRAVAATPVAREALSRDAILDELAALTAPDADAISDEIDSLKKMLLDKNQKYGNAALAPRPIFSRLDPLARLEARLDEKLSRGVTTGWQPEDGKEEDTLKDYIGLLILYRIALKRSGRWPSEKNSPKPRQR